MSDDRPVDAQHAIELQGAGLDHESTGGGAGVGRFVDDAKGQLTFGKPKSEHESCGACAANEDMLSVVVNWHRNCKFKINLLFTKQNPSTMGAKKEVTRILVVEDEGDICLLLELLLVGRRTVVDHVHTLTDAKEFIEREQPTLVLLDNRLPDGLGIDFIGYLKGEYPQIKIIMITGVDGIAEDAVLATGADRFISKPFTQAQLQESINHVLN
jgi:CheY-like chemotaxis protein